MSADIYSVCERLKHAGFQIALDGEGNLLVSPASKLTAEQSAWLRAHKSMLVVALGGGPPPADDALRHHTQREMEYLIECNVLHGETHGIRPTLDSLARATDEPAQAVALVLADMERRGKVVFQGDDILSGARI